MLGMRRSSSFILCHSSLEVSLRGLIRWTRAQVKAVQEYLKELLETTDQKLLVFAHHKDLLDGIEFIMNKSGPASFSCFVLFK